MRVTMALPLIVVLATTGCSNKPAEDASVAVSGSEATSVSIPDAKSPPSSSGQEPSWEIGEDIAGKTVMIDGKQEVIPDDLAESKRKMDAAAKDTLDAMDALEKRRLARFNDPDMKP